jgi:hypothetical protein
MTRDDIPPSADSDVGAPTVPMTVQRPPPAPRGLPEQLPEMVIPVLPPPADPAEV